MAVLDNGTFLFSLTLMDMSVNLKVKLSHQYKKEFCRIFRAFTEHKIYFFIHLLFVILYLHLLFLTYAFQGVFVFRQLYYFCNDLMLKTKNFINKRYPINNHERE